MRTETVHEPGEYAIRGGIIDLFPPGYEQPVRIDLFGDDIESIRVFDPASQRTQKKINQFSLKPAAEFFLDEESIHHFRSRYRELCGTIPQGDPLYESISEGRRYNGMDHWLPLFFENMDTIFDYIPARAITLDYHAQQAQQERLTQIEDFYQSRKTLETAAAQKKNSKKSKDISLSGAVYHPLPPQYLYLQEEEWQQQAAEAQSFSPFGQPAEAPGTESEGRKGRDFADIRALPDGDLFAELAKHISALRQQDRHIIIACYSKGARDRLKGLMENTGFTNLVDCKKL